MQYEWHLQSKSYKILQWWLVFNDDFSWPLLSHVDSFSLFSSPVFWRKIALPWQRSCNYVICWTMSNLFECSFCLSLFFNIPVFFLPWFYVGACSFYLTLSHIFLYQAPSTVLSGIVFYSRIIVVFLSLILPEFCFCLVTSLHLLNFTFKNRFFHDIHNNVHGDNGLVERHVHGPDKRVTSNHKKPCVLQKNFH